MASKVYEIVLKQIVADLKAQIEEIKKDPTVRFSWIKPWGSSGMPFNDDRGRYYSGINLLILKKGGAYLTPKVIKERGLTLKQGARYDIVYFWAPTIPKKAEEEDEDAEIADEVQVERKRRLVFKFYKVYHESQIENFERKHHKLGDMPSTSDVETRAVDSLQSYCEHENISLNVHESHDAFYLPTADSITVPDPRQFKRTSEFISTLGHECIHSTGHSKRLNRGINNEFGDGEYSKEELVAEIGTSILSAMLGVQEDSTYQNNIAYILGWLKKLEDDVTLITYAAQRAQKAADYILQYADYLEYIQDKAQLQTHGTTAPTMQAPNTTAQQPTVNSF